jgi:CO/xanthine dehydrogenase FAD-binding subunit
MVELQPSKLITRVRFPSPAPMCMPFARKFARENVSTGLVAVVAKPVLILLRSVPMWLSGRALPW